MDIKHLDTFLAAAEELNFTKAARRLHLSQPPLSMRIRELEDELRVTLFRRSTRKVALTPAGQVFYEKVREIRIAIDAAVEACRDVERGVSGQLRIAYTAMGSDVVLPRLIRAFRTMCPEIDLKLQGPLSNGSLELALLNEDTDVALCFLPMEAPTLATRVLTTRQLAVVLPDRHSLAALKRVPVARLGGEPFVAYPAGKGIFLQQAIEAECMRAGFRPRVVQEASAVQSLLCLVAAGKGVAIIPLENKWRSTIGVVFRQLSPKERPLRYGIAWRQSDRSAALRQFLSVAAEVFPRG